MVLFLVLVFVFIIIYLFAKQSSKSNSDDSILSIEQEKSKINLKIKSNKNAIVTYHNSIPLYRRKLLYTSNKNIEDIKFNIGNAVEFQIGIKDGKVFIESLRDTEKDEPSTIFYKLPILAQKDWYYVEKLDYYPSYARMTPSQRYKYINWLINPERQIDIGYVFVYYYGLERQLMTGNFEESFKEILLLRKHHINRSFINYSNIALTHACLVKSKYEYIEKLLESIDVKFVDSVVILMLYYSKKPINSIYVYGLIDDIINVTNVSRLKNYYKNNPELLFKNLNLIMSNKFPGGNWHFYNDFDLSDISITQHSAFANYSFPDDLRKVDFPDFLKNSKFVDTVYNIISESHDMTKNDLKELIGINRKYILMYLH